MQPSFSHYQRRDLPFILCAALTFIKWVQPFAYHTVCNFLFHTMSAEIYFSHYVQLSRTHYDCSFPNECRDFLNPLTLFLWGHSPFSHYQCSDLTTTPLLTLWVQRYSPLHTCECRAFSPATQWVQRFPLSHTPTLQPWLLHLRVGGWPSTRRGERPHARALWGHQRGRVIKCGEIRKLQGGELICPACETTCWGKRGEERGQGRVGGGGQE